MIYNNEKDGSYWLSQIYIFDITQVNHHACDKSLTYA